MTHLVPSIDEIAIALIAPPVVLSLIGAICVSELFPYTTRSEPKVHTQLETASFERQSSPLKQRKNKLEVYPTGEFNIQEDDPWEQSCSR